MAVIVFGRWNKHFHLYITTISLFPGNSGITAKNGWYNKVTMTTLNKITVALLFKKKNGGKIPGNFREGTTEAR